tara:strand:- start:655 stop:2106 length:1452 start_codon:yes stop_codon:yes gene_type:complete
MTLLDPQGRLFGKYNLVDVLVVLVILTILLFAGTRFAPGNQKHLYVTVWVKDVTVWFASGVEVGDYAGSKNNPSLLITDVKVFDVGKSGKRDVQIKFKTAVHNLEGQWYYGEEKLTIGNKVELDTFKMSFEGKITGVDEEGEIIPEVAAKRVITMEVNNVPDWQYETFRIGLTENDSKGNVVAEITDIKPVKINNNGADIMVKVQINLAEINDELYFKTKQVLLGSRVTVKTLPTELRGTVIDIEEANEANKKIIVREVEKIVEINADSVPVDLAASISVGDREFDSEGNPIAEVLETYSSFSTYTERNLVVRIRIVGELIKGGIFFKGNKIARESELTFNSKDTLLSGAISKIYDVSASLPTFETEVLEIIEIEATGIESFISDAIQTGIIESDPLNDKSVLEILSKGTKAHSITIITDDGQILKQSHPTLKDVSLRLRLLLAKSKDGELFFKGKSIKVGGKITIEMPNVDITGAITTIQES